MSHKQTVILLRQFKRTKVSQRKASHSYTSMRHRYLSTFQAHTTNISKIAVKFFLAGPMHTSLGKEHNAFLPIN